MEDFPDALNFIEYEALARALLPLIHFELIAGGSDDNVTVAANRKAFDGWVIVPRFLFE